jgi:uncharacterized protein YbjT (DUF2867 family)
MILITGATGTIGRHLVRQCTDRNLPIRALVRSSAKGEDLGVPFAIVDLDDPASLPPALDRIDALFVNGAVSSRMAAQQQALIDAALASGIRHFVRVSAAGAALASDRPVNRWHAQVDHHLATSGANCALLKPTIFMQVLLGNAASVAENSTIVSGFGVGRLAFIDPADIAACALELLIVRPKYGEYVLTGPEALSLDDVAARLSTLLGRTIRHIARPPEELEAAMLANGLDPEVARSFRLMMESFADGGASKVTTTIADICGRPAHPLDSFLRENIQKFQRN